jgi:solute carrier family 25 protein 33/36
MAASEAAATGRNPTALQIVPPSTGSITKLLIPFAAGALGGSVAAAILSPLDIVRTRMQSAMLAARRPAPIPLFYEILRNEGPFALYRGLVPTILGVGPSRALYFGSYAIIKKFFADRLGFRERLLDVSTASVAGVFTNTIMSPWWVIRLRLQLQQNRLEPVWRTAAAKLRRYFAAPGMASAAITQAQAATLVAGDAASTLNAAVVGAAGSGAPQYSGVINCAVRMYKEEGWTSFYRGLTASYLGVIETAVQFALYGEMKRAIVEAQLPIVRAKHAVLGQHMPSEELLRREAYSDGLAFATSAVTKLVASALTYPHEVLRTRMREQRSGSVRYTSIMQTIQLILREEGVRGLYGGMSVHLVRTVPNAAILMLVVEKLVGGNL